MSWYSACINEVQSFLDTYADPDTDELTVRVDDDLIAALVGLIAAASVTAQIVGHLGNASIAAAYLID